MPTFEVSELAIYPVKSFGQISLSKSIVDSFGLHNDRRWMVVDSDGQFVTQRQQSRMCLVQPKLLMDGILLEAPGYNSVSVPIPNTQHRTTVTVWKDRCQVIDAGDKAAHWLSAFLEIDCRLVYFPDDEIRQVDPTFAQSNDKTAFSDGFPILLVSQASLDDLNQRLDIPIPMARFRPNVVIQGCDAFAEDNWRRLRIGDLTLRVVKPCSRCVIPSIDFTTAERGPEPTRTLINYRKRDNNIFFGQNVIADGEGYIEVGMKVDVLEYA